MRDVVTQLTSQPLAQFGAVTFVDEAGAAYVILYGTDVSAAGWVKDACSGLDFPMDSQLWAINCLVLATAWANGSLTVVSHSEGVNLTLCAAAATASPTLKHVYAFDPVGFPVSVTDDGFLLGIDRRMRVYVMAGSRVSPFLPLPTPATVITSPWPGPPSHNPYAWRS